MDRSYQITATTPLLTYSMAENLLRSRRFVRHAPPPLRSAARLFRRASGRRMRLREPSVLVRDNAAEELEERQSYWAHSKPVILLDLLWNLALVFVGFTVMGLSMEEKPVVPLRIWVAGYSLQCVVRVGCVVVEYRRRPEAGLSEVGWGSGGSDSFGSGSEGRYYETDQQGMADEETSVTKNMESANSLFSFLWWCVGFYWVTGIGRTLLSNSPHLYWLCVAFLAFDMVFVFVCVGVACLIGIAVCCCLPCIIAILYAVTDQDGATEEEIDSLPKFKFCRMDNFKKVNGEVQASEGLMTECDTSAPKEHVISPEDAECCICLSVYDNGAELRQLPCHHHFHCTCIDKWLRMNATCPLCKFNIIKPSSQIGRGIV